MIIDAILRGDAIPFDHIGIIPERRDSCGWKIIRQCQFWPWTIPTFVFFLFSEFRSIFLHLRSRLRPFTYWPGLPSSHEWRQYCLFLVLPPFSALLCHTRHWRLSGHLKSEFPSRPPCCFYSWLFPPPFPSLFLLIFHLLWLRTKNGVVMRLETTGALHLAPVPFPAVSLL